MLHALQLRANYWANLQSLKALHPTKMSMVTLDKCWESEKIEKESYCNVILNINGDIGINDWAVSKSVSMPAVPTWYLPQVSSVKLSHTEAIMFKQECIQFASLCGRGFI